MTASRWTPERDRALRRMWQAGVPTTQLEREFGVGRTAIRERADRLGLERRGTSKLDKPWGYTNLSPLAESRQKQRAELHKRKVATLKHLLDLKRAGYSPRHTELSNPPDTGRPVSFL